MSAIERTSENREPHDVIAGFCANVMELNNGAHMQVADFMARLPVESRARFIERCTSMSAAVAETMAGGQ
jgi:hypothetical protein